MRAIDALTLDVPIRSMGKGLGNTSIEKYVSILDEQLKYAPLLREVHAAVHNKSVDDPDLRAFFKFKCWL